MKLRNINRGLVLGAVLTVGVVCYAVYDHNTFKANKPEIEETVESYVKAIVDEYDKSLELGFLPDMKAIAGRLKNLSTVILTSATKLKEIPDFLVQKSFRTFDWPI